MPRAKGNKNRPKHTTNSAPKTDFTFQIAEKQETIAALNTEIASITANIDTLKADLKEKKQRRWDRGCFEKKLLSSGMNADEILENWNKIDRVDKLNSRSSHGLFWRPPYSLWWKEKKWSVRKMNLSKIHHIGLHERCQAPLNFYKRTNSYLQILYRV